MPLPEPGLLQSATSAVLVIVIGSCATDPWVTVPKSRVMVLTDARAGACRSRKTGRCGAEEIPA